MCVHALLVLAGARCRTRTRSLSPGRRMRLGGVLMLMLFAAAMAGAQSVPVVNTLANGYSSPPALPENCPNGKTVTGIPSGYHIERPHVVFNTASNEWVMWAHYDNSNYTTAEALVATSATECGPYTIYQTFQPLGKQVRDDFLFKDTDGTAYFLAASNQNGGANDSMAIWKLTSDYLNVDSSAGTVWVFSGAYREAPVVFKAGSIYYLLASQAAGWLPSQAAYITSTSMLSGWSASANLGNASTFGGQNADLTTYSGSAGSAYILNLDHLGGPTYRDDGNLYLPVLANPTARTATLEWTPAFQVNPGTGSLTIPSRTNLAAGASASASSTLSGSSASNATDGNYATLWAANGNVFPSWWQVDLGSNQTVNNVDISWYMVKGSEAYYQYQLQYSTDGANFTTIDRTANMGYGFTSDQVNFTARYLRINIINAVLINNPGNWYTPQLWEVKVFGPSNSFLSVPNASFETPVTSNYTYNPSGGSWTFSGASGNGSGVAANGSGFTAGNLAAPNGSQVAFIQGTGSISQSIGGFTAGKRYTVTFAASQRQNKTGGQAGNTFTLSVNGTSLRTFTPPQAPAGYNDYSVSFTATSSSNTIKFTGTNASGGDNTVLLDNVRIWTPNF